MKKLILLISLFTIITTSCDYDVEDLVTLALIGGNGDISKEVEKAVEQVSQKLFSEGKVESIQFGNNNFIKPLPPYTYQDIQIILENSLKKILGGNWEKILNDYINNHSNLAVDIKDFPQDIVAEIMDANSSFSTDITTDTGTQLYYYTTLGTGAWATASCAPTRGIVPVPGGPFFGYWLYGVTKLVLSFHLPNDSPYADVITVEVRDENINPYDFDIVSGRTTDTRGFIMETGWYSGLFSYPKLYISGWTITVYETATPEVWTASF